MLRTVECEGCPTIQTGACDLADETCRGDWFALRPIGIPPEAWNQGSRPVRRLLTMAISAEFFRWPL